MTNVTHLHTHRTSTLTPTTPQQSGNTITLQRALATNANPAALRAVANWNERKSHDERRRKARMRHRAQAVALRDVAAQMEESYVGSYREAA